MNSPTQAPLPSHPMRVTLRVTQQPTTGKFSAAIVEFPEYQAEATTREAAIVAVKTAFLEQSTYVETIPWDVNLSGSEPAWQRSAGVFRDNAAFDDVMQRIQDEREAWGDEAMDVSEYVR
jgi:hypothetical protein